MLSFEQASKLIGSDAKWTEDEILALIKALTPIAQLAVDWVLSDIEPDGGDSCVR